MSNGTQKQDFVPVLAGLKNFAATPDQLIPLLQYVQGELGFLAPETMSGIAEYLRLPMSHVYGVATFYAQFRFRPLGKNRLTVCRGTACHVRGSGRLVEEMENILGIKAGETTADMMFSLETVACLGSCALAPAVVVNDKVHGKVTAKKLHKIVEELRGGVAKAEDADEAPEQPAAAPAVPAVPAPQPAELTKPAAPTAPKPVAAPVSASPAPSAKKAVAKKPATKKSMKTKSAPAKPAGKKAAKPAKSAKKSAAEKAPVKNSAAKQSAVKKAKPARPAKAAKKPAAKKSSKRRPGR